MTSLRTQLEELAGKATKGPWSEEVIADGLAQCLSAAIDRVGGIAVLSALVDGQHKNDAALIVALVNNLPTILAALDAVELRDRIAAKARDPIFLQMERMWRPYTASEFDQNNRWTGQPNPGATIPRGPLPEGE